MADYPLIPGYGGGNMGAYGLPGMGGIEDALARNAQLGAQQAQKPKFNIGDFLLAWAGHLGDNLTGNPVYARTQESRAASEAELRAEERKRRNDMDDWVARKQWERDNSPPNYEGNIDHYDQAKARGLIPQEMPYPQFLHMVNPGAKAPVILPHNVEQVGGPALSSGAGDLRQQAIEAIQQGADPAKVLERMKSLMGGPTASAPSGGFPGY